ncbi:MAG TPA: hypothetical protein VEL03_14575 [Streptosporangiaceae bacterium]|nr:hypothetical protein [Streptosporangiaceae bacterium]
MHIPVYLEVAQWALLLGLGCLVVVMYRQLGRLLRHPDHAAEFGPAVGSQAGQFRYERVPDGATGQVTPGDGRPILIAFVDPTCPACEQLVTSLGELRDADRLAGARILLLISDPPSYLGVSAVFSATSLEIGRPVSARDMTGYRAEATPLLVAVDGAGVVRAAGVASTPGQVRAMAAALGGLHLTSESEVA